MIHLARVRSRLSARALCLALTLVALPLTTTAAPRVQEVAVAAHPDAHRLGDVVRRSGSAARDLSSTIDVVGGEHDA